MAGDEIIAGSVCIAAVATPGHRPEHLTFVVSDLSRGPEPWMVLTGDSLLVGDIARPDLAVEAREGAHDLHASLRRLLDLDDHVEVWPAHIGGSLCGGSHLSGKSSSTIGFERRHNPLLGLDEGSFVEGLTAELPSRPPNIERIVELNRGSGGASPPEPGLLTGDALLSLLGTGATVLDSRVPAEFDTGHVAGSINLPVSAAGVGTRAGWALDPEAAVVIVARDMSEAGRDGVRASGGRFLEPRGRLDCGSRGVAAPLGPRGPRGLLGSSSSSPTGCATTPWTSSTSASPASGSPATSPAPTTCR